MDNETRTHYLITAFLSTYEMDENGEIERSFQECGVVHEFRDSKRQGAIDKMKEVVDFKKGSVEFFEGRIEQQIEVDSGKIEQYTYMITRVVSSELSFYKKDL